MPENFLSNFKKSFPEVIPDINENLVKKYLKEEIYDFEDPVYGDDNQSEIQMQKLIRKAEGLGLGNFISLLGFSKNKKIKECAEVIIYSLKINNIDSSLYRDKVFACGEGTLTNLQNILLDIYGFRSFKAIISRLKKEMLENFAGEILSGAKTHDNQLVLQKFRPRGDLWHIHDISVILNVLANEWKLIKKRKIEDKYLDVIDNIFDIRRINTYINYKVQNLLENYEELVDLILYKLESDLPKFNILSTLDTGYIKHFSDRLDEWIEQKSEDFKFLGGSAYNNLFCAQALKQNTDKIELFRYKDHYKKILRIYIILFLDNISIILLNSEKRQKLIDKLLINCGLPLNIEIIPDDLLEYAIDNDLFIINNKNHIIDPVKLYLNSNKREYALAHLKQNCIKYGGNLREILIILNNPFKSDLTYSDIISEMKFQKQCFDIFREAIINKQESLVQELFKSAMSLGVLEELLIKNDNSGSLFDYAFRNKNNWLVNQILDIAIYNVEIFQQISSRDITTMNLYKYPDMSLVINNYSNARNEIINEIKDQIIPAKWSYYMPNFVSNFTDRFNYNEERNALISQIVDEYLKKEKYSLQDICDNKEIIKAELKYIIKDRKPEINEFLNREGNYNLVNAKISPS
ncbi:hypothetical protein [Candidatus Aquarickettsia rohweri]|uniref:Uncharacterized protein n=1 Tax=Candidatus Aquarickettsia rohweri TaxID=2602574 RepID=A0A3S0A754_9RICK|nr:hypothetical protein [Candidatus Aquarickettsia rohweri]RST66107.1 hypothetical protein EIC27_03825 [Candidatus Aquarickettsia rohweri]